MRCSWHSSLPSSCRPPARGPALPPPCRGAIRRSSSRAARQTPASAAKRGRERRSQGGSAAALADGGGADQTGSRKGYGGAASHGQKGRRGGQGREVGDSFRKNQKQAKNKRLVEGAHSGKYKAVFTGGGEKGGRRKTESRWRGAFRQTESRSRRRGGRSRSCGRAAPPRTSARRTGFCPRGR